MEKYIHKYKTNEYHEFLKCVIEKLISNKLLGGFYSLGKDITKIKEEVSYDILVSGEQNGYSYELPWHTSYIDDFLARFGEFKQDFEMFPAHKESIEINDEINKFIDENEYYKNRMDMLNNLSEYICRLFEGYQRYCSSDGKNEDIMEFIDICIEYSSFLDRCLEYCNNILELVTEDLNIPLEGNTNETIEIQLLDNDYSFKEFTSLLVLINKIYEEIGNVIYIEGEKYQELKIVKVESGSLLSKLVGDKNILETVGLLLNKIVDLVFMKYTQEGKLLRCRELMNMLKDEAELCTNLYNLGYDIKESREDIEISFAHVTKDIEKIARSSAKIRVNKESYSIGDAMKEVYLSDARTCLIENIEEDEEE